MSHNKVTFSREARCVEIHSNGIVLTMTFTTLRQLTSNGLDDAIAEAHGIDMSPEADAELARACAEMEARKTGKLREAIEEMVNSHPMNMDLRGVLIDSLVNAIESVVADDDVVREAYSRDYAKTLEAIRRHMSEIPELDGQSGASAINFLATALLESQDEVRELLYGGAELNKPGTPSARFFGLMRELEKRFPGVVDKYSSEPPELRLLAAIDALKIIKVNA